MKQLLLSSIEEKTKRDKLGRFIKGTSNPWNKGMVGYTNSGSFTSEGTKGENNPFYGKCHSEKSKKKISLHNAMRCDPEVRKKISKALTGRKLSKEVKDKISIATKRRVKNGTHNFWKGGISKYYSEINHSLRNKQWRDWREKVFERDNYTCQRCKAKCGNGKAIILHPHHIVPVVECVKKNNFDLIYDKANGKTVCIDCHKIIHGKIANNA